ncbi:N-acetylmuramic acid 6-phosphate etherase [Pannonibacter tanglangensis]|uniref:N-acetylmuramic acid 6-phosphate etherase n=1 Tax=Pannonibacter tanglangensis TaxID=2750084 RepID=A0ABW9ZMI8_9HYPH|nr:N-acetylmuramic acid 6-phosphate etherase [Pannonibacter sp. XCT-34]NBN63960.1 N-acetylmuramic acid 6-phosphate etherase [Pannonibacter sp. XCT-34]
MTKRRTETRHAQADALHASDATETVRAILDAQAEALTSIAPAAALVAEAGQAMADAIAAGHRVIYAGAGSSGLMALADCLEIPGTFGVARHQVVMLFAGGADALLDMPGAVEDDASLADADVNRVQPGPGDLVIAVSASGSTPYTLAVALSAKARGARVVSLASVQGSPLLDMADIALFIDTGPEILAGSTRLGAATAQKATLNTISTLAGVRLGHVHEGRMVNVVADNAKLVDRAAGMVADLSGKDLDTARAALAETAGAVKPAILIACGATVAQANELLADAGGHVGPALARLRQDA